MKQLIILLTMLLASESVFTQTVLNPPSLTNSPWATSNHNFEDTTVWAPRKQTRVQSSCTTIDISEVPNGVYTIQCEYMTRDFGKQTSSTMFVVSK